MFLGATLSTVWKKDVHKHILLFNRGDVIRTRDLYVPNVALYQAEPHPVCCLFRNVPILTDFNMEVYLKFLKMEISAFSASSTTAFTFVWTQIIKNIVIGEYGNNQAYEDTDQSNPYDYDTHEDNIDKNGLLTIFGYFFWRSG